MNEYEIREILRLLARTTAEPGRVKNPEQLRQESLRLAFLLSDAGKAITDSREIVFHVPTRTGWIDARQAYFGEGWPGTCGRRLHELVAVAGASSKEIASIEKVTLPPFKSWPIPEGSEEDWCKFLARIAVSDTLRPVQLIQKVGRVDGHMLAYRLLNQSDLKEDARRIWAKDIVPLGHQIPNPNTPYTVAGPVSQLPAQNDFDQLPPIAKEIYAREVFFVSL